MSTQANSSDIFFLIDNFVTELEDHGYSMEEVIDSLKEYAEICEDYL